MSLTNILIHQHANVIITLSSNLKENSGFNFVMQLKKEEQVNDVITT